MLRRPSDVVADCYKRAGDARDRALQANDLHSREFWLRAEERWLKMADHFEAGERINSFVRSRFSVVSYAVRELGPQSWEWIVCGTGSRILAAGRAENAVDARVGAFQFIADLEAERPQ